MSFFFSVLSFFFKLWERERVYKIGYKGKRSQSLLIFFFRRSSCGEYFLFYGLIDFMLFLVLAWRNGSFVSEIFFCLLLPGVLGFGSVRHEPCPTTNFVFSFFPWWEEGATSVFRVPANHMASTFFLLVSGDPREVTEYKHLYLTVILWRLATVNSNTRIVVILFLSSQWDTTWHIGQSSHKMYSNNTEFSRVYDNFKCPYKNSLETYRMHLVCIEPFYLILITSPITRFGHGGTTDITCLSRGISICLRLHVWRQHPTRHQLYGHLPPITKTIQVRRTRHAGHCWRSRDELIRDVLLWTPTYGRAKAGRPARTYIQQLCEDTGCCPEDLPRAMNDREE